MMEVNLNNLRNNVHEITKDGRHLIGVVKNNAYGCGALKVSQELVKCGIEYLLVNDLEEAAYLFDNGIKVRILVFNGIRPYEYELLAKYPDVVISLNSLEDCLSLNSHCHFPMRVHIQIDTGLNRLGIRDEKEFDEVLKILKSNKKFIIEGIYTHFANVDYAPKQVEKFKPYVNKFDFKMVHCAASSTYSAINFGNYVRCGLALYTLSPVMSVKTYPLTIRRLQPGDTLGYNFEYVAKEEMTVAVLPIGYGNGYRLKFSGFKVYAHGNYYQVIGRVCMNHIFVKVDEKVDLKTEFYLMNEKLPASELASYVGVHPYEILTNWHFDKVQYTK